MKYWKEHVGLRLGLIFAFFVAGMVLMIVGWKMTGQLGGLGEEIVGPILHFWVRLVVNKPFEDTKKRL